MSTRLVAGVALGISLALGCSERPRRPAAANAPPALPPASPMSFGAAMMPPVLAGVELGMSPQELRAARPRAYESGAKPWLFHEELASNLSAHYTFARGRLASVLLRQSDAAAHVPQLVGDARRRWGEPAVLLGAPWFSAPGALVRVEGDLGNLIVEIAASMVNR